MKSWYVILLSIFVGSCASFTSTDRVVQNINFGKTTVKIKLDHLIRDSSGKGFLSVDNEVSDFANASFEACRVNCKGKVEVQMRFIADVNSRSTLFSIWKWSGILSLGIIPVVETTDFTLIAEISYQGKAKEIRKKGTRYIASHLLLFPFYLFDDWKKKQWDTQKNLILEVYQEIESDILKE